MAWVVDGHDNGMYFFRDRDDLERCPACKMLTQKWQAILPENAASRLKADVSASYDGVEVVSSNFRSAYDRAGLFGLRFRQVGIRQWAVMPERTVAFDVAARKTRREKRCDVCGLFASVAGATPAYLVPGQMVAPAEFVRTDIEFGSGDEQHPLIICGDVAGSALNAAKLSGLELSQVRWAK
jgi:hypothetical protein